MGTGEPGEAGDGNNSEARTMLQGAARSSVLSFSGALISGLAGFGLSLLLGRTVGPEGNGIVFQMISVFMISSALAKLGLDTTCVWLLPRLAVDDRDSVRRATSLVLIGSLLGGVTTGVIVFLLAATISVGQPELFQLLRVAGIFTPIAALGTVALAVTRGLGGIRPFVLIGSVGLPTARLVCIAIAMAFAASALLAGLIWLGLLLVATGLSLIAVKRELRPFSAATSRTQQSRIDLARPIARYAAPRLASSVMEQAIVWQDVLIVGIIAGPKAAGIYGVVSRLAQAGFIPSTSMRIVVAPQFSRLLHQGRTAELAEFYARTAQWIALMCAPAYILLMVLGRPVLNIFGDGFEAGTEALLIVSIGALLWTSAGNVQSLLLMSGRSGWAALNKLVVLTLSLCCLVVLVPIWGIVGAAAAWTVSMTVDVVLTVVLVRVGVGVNVDITGTGLAILVASASMAVPALVARLVLGETALALVTGILIALVLYAGVLYLLRARFALDQALTVFTRRGGR